jgi:hypothetical protein
MGKMLQAPPSGAGTAPTIAAIDSQSISVSWSAITSANTGFSAAQYIKYLVETTPSLYMLSAFASGTTPTEWTTPTWQFLDNSGIQFYSFQTRQMLISSTAGGDCNTLAKTTTPNATYMQCPVAHRTIPAAILASQNFFIEGYAFLDSKTQTGTAAGIAICESC